MENITELIKKIRSAILGKDVRESIARAIEKCYEDAIGSGNTDMEVSEARGIYDTLKNRLDNSDNTKADKTSVENLQTQINSLASGSPLVAGSVSEMTDTSKIYVNTTDGHWYYYNENNWIDGGVYQATEIANESINEDKLKDKAVTTEKTNFASIGVNKFNINDANLYYALTTQNNLQSNSQRFVTNYIKVNPNDVLHFYSQNENGTINVKFIVAVAVNDDKSEIIESTSSMAETYTIPSGASYVRFSFDINYLNKFQVRLNNLDNRFQPFTIVPNSWENVIIDNSNFLMLGKNKFNPDTILSNYTLNTNGVYALNETRFTTDFIKVTQNDIITSSYTDEDNTRKLATMISIVSYDKDLKPLNNYLGESLKTYTVLQNEEYIRISFEKSQLKDLMITINDTNISYFPYAIYTKGGVTQEEFANSKTINNFTRVQDIFYKLVNATDKLNVKLIGDSITHGVGGTGFTNDAEHGEHIVGDQYVNTNGHCWANSLKDYLEEKFNCTCNNFRYSWF